MDTSFSSFRKSELLTLLEKKEDNEGQIFKTSKFYDKNGLSLVSQINPALNGFVHTSAMQ